MQGAGNLAVACMVVENCCNALLDAVHIQGIGAGTGALQRQVAVNGPPCTVQYLIEIVGIVAGNGKPAG